MRLPFLLPLTVACQSGVAPLPCTDTLGCVELGPDAPVRLGALMDLSGAAANVGQEGLDAIELALAEHGAVLGRDTDLVYEDSGCDAVIGATAARDIVEREALLAVVGTSCSGAALEAAPLLSAAGLVVISPSNTHPALTRAAVHEAGYFRACHNDAWQAAAAARFAFHELGATYTVVIHAEDDYSEALTEAFEGELDALGGVVSGAISVGALSSDAALAAAADLDPDALFLALDEPAGADLLGALADVDELEGTPVVGTEWLSEGEAPGGLWLTGPDLDWDSEDYAAFEETWIDAHGARPISGYHAFAWDGARMLIAAIERAAVPGDDGVARIGRSALRREVERTADFDGLTGSLTCAASGDCGVDRIRVFDADGEAVWP